MKKLLLLSMFLVFGTQIDTHAQETTKFDFGEYTLEACSSGSCSVFGYKKEHNPTVATLAGDSMWNESIRVHFLVDDQITVNLQTILDAIAEDSQIAKDEGLYCGEGDAYVYAGQQNIDLTEATDLGWPLQTDFINVAVATLDDPTLGTLFDSYVLEARECYGAQKINTIIRNSALGVQENSTRGFAPEDNIHPSETFKQDAYNHTGIRGHAISHSAGWNHPDHQNGPDPTQRPMQTNDGKSYGWSTSGNLGFSGGTNLGVGPDGEDIAGYIRVSHPNWLTIMPNLAIENLTGPSTTETGSMVSFSASTNKDIENENWTWEFTNGNSNFNESGDNVNVSFSETGTWSYTVTVTNDCGGQTATMTGTVEVTSSNSAPVAKCLDNLTLSLDSDGMTTLLADDLDNGSTDDSGIESTTIDGKATLDFNCDDLGQQDITFTVTDAEGLSSSCVTSVTIIDDLAPTLECIDEVITIKLEAGQDTTLIVSQLIENVSDNCDTTVDLGNATFSGNDPGDKTVTVTVTDDSNNSSTCTVNVIVELVLSIDIIEVEGISVYPNPFEDNIFIDISPSLSIDKVILTTSIGQKKEEPVTSVLEVGGAPGLYILELLDLDESGRISQKYHTRIIKVR